jgi:hypothetical protein
LTAPPRARETRHAASRRGPRRILRELNVPIERRIYEELYEVYRWLYPKTREAMHRLTGLATTGRLS